MNDSTWLNIPSDSDFSLHNLPFGIYSTKKQRPQVGVAIGTDIIDMAALNTHQLLAELHIDPRVFDQSSLNAFMTLGASVRRAVRVKLQVLLREEDSPLRGMAERILIPQQEAKMHLPVEIGDYTDFYSSLEHATNVGTMFRGAENALPPQWKYMPIAYHGRASSIVVSGTDIHRPQGQTMPKGAERPEFGPSQALDFEVEMAFVVGKDSQLGQRITPAEAGEYIFGMVLFNDWSARDIQRWEYVPLGPFLGKNFASSVSPWVVTWEALEHLRTAGPKQQPEPLSYLRTEGEQNFDIHLEAALQAEGKPSTTVCRSNSKYLYWNVAQQLAHHTVNGCNVRVGDLMASGTISGPSPDSQGSLLELTQNGEQPLTLSDGEQRTFLADGDTVTMCGYGEKEGIRIGFGEVRTTILSTT